MPRLFLAFFFLVSCSLTASMSPEQYQDELEFQGRVLVKHVLSMDPGELYELRERRKDIQNVLPRENERIAKRGQRMAFLYDLGTGAQILNVNQKLFQHTDVSEETKRAVQEQGRAVYVFSYPSDDFAVKGFFSTPRSLTEDTPLLLFLRGGNRQFGIPHPAVGSQMFPSYAILGTLYRDEDEFGGEDVNDVYALWEFFPQLLENLGLDYLPSKVFLLGASRGVMQAFLALERNRRFQRKIDKVVALSGPYDMREVMYNRYAMELMFRRDFGLTNENYEEWVTMRSPIEGFKRLRKDLPFLLIQGGNDPRVNPYPVAHAVRRLRANGNPTTFWYDPWKGHFLFQEEALWPLIRKWLEAD